MDGHAAMTRPITLLLKDNADFYWNEECDRGSTQVNDALASEPILCNPDWSKEFYINSGFGINKEKISSCVLYAMSLIRDSKCYTIFDGVLYCQGIDGVLRRAINAEEASKVVKQYHDGFCGGHYAADYPTKKILHAGYYWPTLFKDVALHCKTCEFCQFFGKKDVRLGQHHPVISIHPF